MKKNPIGQILYITIKLKSFESFIKMKIRKLVTWHFCTSIATSLTSLSLILFHSPILPLSLPISSFTFLHISLYIYRYKTQEKLRHVNKHGQHANFRAHDTRGKDGEMKQKRERERRGMSHVTASLKGQNSVAGHDLSSNGRDINSVSVSLLRHIVALHE